MFHEKRLPILAIDLIGMLKGYLFSNGRHTKGGGGGVGGVPFLSKIVYMRVRSWTSGRVLPI